jgi:hypothetical protein
MTMDDDWPDFPVILGQGACHTLTDGPPKLNKRGKPVKPKKRRPIGFQFPPKVKRK